ncbi:hypothetical protein [Bradyrhizobium sp. BWA-3-5]|uniref:hypothetical protein n=1 Tax=Bradyrhizobium sp. BWA-3-5 TaxID=3080013 RepID=UPI00293F3551|nr:hypothetical protein [Bradyrhizobium sp. BWA-3-5]WOH63791.1 hypothetical protein RX331_24195 [Bradyrhizobium sp. BWA-3-5]
MRKTSNALLCLSSHALFMREPAHSPMYLRAQEETFFFFLHTRRMNQSIGFTTVLRTAAMLVLQKILMRRSDIDPCW